MSNSCSLDHSSPNTSNASRPIDSSKPSGFGSLGLNISPAASDEPPKSQGSTFSPTNAEGGANTKQFRIRSLKRRSPTGYRKSHSKHASTSAFVPKYGRDPGCASATSSQILCPTPTRPAHSSLHLLSSSSNVNPFPSSRPHLVVETGYMQQHASASSPSHALNTPSYNSCLSSSATEPHHVDSPRPSGGYFAHHMQNGCWPPPLSTPPPSTAYDSNSTTYELWRTSNENALPKW